MSRRLSDRMEGQPVKISFPKSYRMTQQLHNSRKNSSSNTSEEAIREPEKTNSETEKTLPLKQLTQTQLEIWQKNM
ncbi:hypothetical protein AYI69_g1773 [Smittium culicis]|uniref:Uncharacterized protein n=1 Tax=Smittium culicis TaxID=133412 RepID=A0A1R1YPC3_9FUNG|nr:hypothetical protein AYI69_g1773 [Smittium culicis]